MDKNARATSSPATQQQTQPTTANQQMATMMYQSNQPNTNFYHPLANQQNQQQLSSSAVADSVRRLQVPNRTTVSPREAFLDYPDGADFREKTLFSTSGSPYSQTQEGQDVSQRQGSESSQSNDEYNVSDTLQENQIPVSAVAAFPVTELHANTTSMSVPVSSRSTSASTPFSGAPSGDMSESDVSSDSEYDPSTTSARRTSRSSGRSGQLAKSFACAECGKRFDKSQPLQVHRRNSHGKGSGPPSLNQGKFSNTSHRCDWIDPSTGKMCNTVFSRPYDLIRHYETKHSAKRQEFICPHCEDKKSFSRSDALRRHLRVKHPSSGRK
jgi:rubredoxin